MQHGVERSLARQRDRRRRQAAADVGVVRVILFEVALLEVAVESLSDAVDHRGVGLQTHAELEAVDEYGRDQRPVGGATGLLFDDRCERQSFVRVRQRQVARARAPCRVQPRVHHAVGARQQRGVGRTAGKEIRVGEEKPFRGCFGGADASHQLGVGQVDHALDDFGIVLQRRLEIAHGPAFDDRDGRLRDIALRQFRHQTGERRPRADLVIARLDRAVGAAHARQRDQRPVGGQYLGSG